MRNNAIFVFVLLAAMLAACIGDGTAILPSPDPANDEPISSMPPGVIDSPVLPEPPVQPGIPAKPPVKDDPMLKRGAVYIDEAQLVVRESYPPQIAVLVTGSLPTPCHWLQVEIAEPNPAGRIDITLYSQVEPDVICVQVLAPFTHTVDLN
ncbi:MAG: hypothetical protein U1B80_06185, partial [Anaerolineaceae bacterium]|nr:hypothetical protein [Anaerolineaceae bacterium]